MRNAIQSLQKASLAFDAEKASAEKKLKKLLHRFARRHFIRRKIRSALCKLRKLLGKECPHHDVAELPMATAFGAGAQDKAFECAAMQRQNGMLPFKPRIGRAGAGVRERRERRERQTDEEETAAFDKRRFPTKRFRKAVERVRAANKKLASFERGFIHEEGIKDREWYRNLDVAPGKWLGERYVSDTNVRTGC